MARSYSIREGFAADQKWLVGKERVYKYEGASGDIIERKYHGLLREDGSPERVAELSKLMEQSAVKIPVFRGQPAAESLDKKAMKEALKRNKEEMSWRQRKNNLFYGGGGMFHFSADIDHALDYASDGGVVEGVLIAKSMLDLRDLKSMPPDFGSRDFQLPKDLEPIKAEWDSKSGQSYSDFREQKSKMEDERDQLIDKKYNDNGVYHIQSTRGSGDSYKDGPMWGRSIKENYQVAKYIDKAVKMLADAYQAKFGTPMPQDIHLKGGADSIKGYGYRETEQRKMLMRNDYAALRKALWNDERFARGPYAYLLMQTTPFKEIVKKAGFDVVAYNDIIQHGDELESFAVMKPNQFKAFAGDKPVNLKSNNMFDAD